MLKIDFFGIIYENILPKVLTFQKSMLSLWLVLIKICLTTLKIKRV